MKVAVIGAGKWGKNLVENFHKLGVLTAIAEPDSEIRKLFNEKYPNVQMVNHHSDLLNLEIECVAVATPAKTHFEIVKTFLLKGLDVFVEKPMTLTSRDSKELVALAQEKEKILMVGHLLLFQPAVQWIKEYIDSGKLGKILSLHQERLNFGQARSVENALWSLGVHDIAVLMYLVNQELVDLQIVGQKAIQQNIEDDLYLHINFKDGTIAHLHTSWLWPDKQRQLTIVGEKGMLTYNETAQVVTFHNKWIESNLKHHDAGKEVLFEGASEPLKLELQHFLDCVKERKQPRSSGASAHKVIEVLENASKILTSPRGLQ